jgi:hypothetical protein
MCVVRMRLFKCPNFHAYKNLAQDILLLYIAMVTLAMSSVWSPK